MKHWRDDSERLWGMNKESDREAFFEKYVMGAVRVVVLGTVGIGVGRMVAQALLERIWPGHPPALPLLGSVAGVVLAYLAYRALLRWDDILSFMGR